MFNKQKKLPEDMTDAEMHEHLGALKGKIAWINKYVPWIAGGLVAAGAAVGGVGVALLPGIGAPLVAMSVMVGVAATGLSLAGGMKSESQNEIHILSEETKHRIEMAKLRQKASAAADASAVTQSTLKLREAFDAAIEKMGSGIENAITVRRPLRLKAGPGAQA
jgi:hypothetical protein